jgi:hypothetical protein
MTSSSGSTEPCRCTSKPCRWRELPPLRCGPRSSSMSQISWPTWSMIASSTEAAWGRQLARDHRTYGADDAGPSPLTAPVGWRQARSCSSLFGEGECRWAADAAQESAGRPRAVQAATSARGRGLLGLPLPHRGRWQLRLSRRRLPVPKVAPVGDPPERGQLELGDRHAEVGEPVVLRVGVEPAAAGRTYSSFRAPLCPRHLGRLGRRGVGRICTNLRRGR